MNNDPTNLAGDQLPLTTERRIDAICLDFERSWQTGQAARIEDYLAKSPETERPALLRELLRLEMDYRQRHGEQPTEEEYAARFPGYTAEVGRWYGDLTTIGQQGRPAAVPFAPQLPGYEILAELGRGGMGVVYKARQVGADRLVALKRIRAGQSASAAEVDRFRREAKAVARLQHPNIVQIHDIDDHDGLPYFSLEYIEGGNLAARLKESPPSDREAAQLIEVLARTVHYAHGRGILHRDLKPANILLTAAGVPKIADFGLAKFFAEEGDTTFIGTVLGTPSYMAPEQAAGKSHEMGPATDVYSLGAILYELLTGQPPFRGPSLAETLRQVEEQAPTPPRVCNPRVDSALQAICLKCLEKVPGDRYASAEALADDLAAYLCGEGVQAHSGTAEWVRPWLRDSRHKEILALHGRSWMWQAWIVFADLLATNCLIWGGCEAIFVYLTLWFGGLILWLFPAWYFILRKKLEMSPVEKQIGQLAIMTVAASGLFLLCAALTGAAPMQVLPMWVLLVALATGSGAIMLRGTFYLLAVLCALSAVIMAVVPSVGPVLFGTAYAIGMSVPAWKNTRSAPNGRALPRVDAPRRENSG